MTPFSCFPVSRPALLSAGTGEFRKEFQPAADAEPQLLPQQTLFSPLREKRTAPMCLLSFFTSYRHT